MSIEVRWHDDKKQCVYLRAEGGWTWRDYQDAMNIMHGMMDESPHEKIDFILDLSFSTLFPRDILNRMKRQGQQSHPKSNKMVVIGAGVFAQTLMKLMEAIAPERMKNIRLCKDMEEAQAFLTVKV